MENVKKELLVLGYNKTQISIMVAAIQGIAVAPALYSVVNDTVKDTVVLNAELTKTRDTLKQIGAAVGMTPPKVKAPAKKKETPPVIAGSDISPNQLDIAGKKASDAKGDDYQAPAAKKVKGAKSPVIAKIEETPEPGQDNERKLEIDL